MDARAHAEQPLARLPQQFASILICIRRGRGMPEGVIYATLAQLCRVLCRQGRATAMSGERPKKGALLQQPITGSTESGESYTRLEVLLLEGLKSGDPIPANREFWQGLRAEAQRLG